MGVVQWEVGVVVVEMVMEVLVAVKMVMEVLVAVELKAGHERRGLS